MKDILSKRLSKQIDERILAKALRQLRIADARSSSIINLASNDYLNLAKHAQVIEAAQEAALEFGTSSAGSPVVASYFSIHKELEQTMSSWIGFKECMLWTSGFTANKSILETILSRDDIVLSDRLTHCSSLKGVAESGARLIRYQHCDIQHLEELLKKHSEQKRLVFVITESLFSMDGDYPDLYAIAQLKLRYPFVWILDEAHALGWYGPKGNGLAAHFRVTEQVDILIATLGKSLASQGAISLFHDYKIKEYLVNYSKDFIYSTYPAPSCVAAANQAAKLISTEVHREQGLWHSKASFLKKKLGHYFSNIIQNESPILPIILKNNDATMLAQERLYKQDILVGAMRPPSVPEGSSRLRLSLHKDIDERIIAKGVIQALDLLGL